MTLISATFKDVAEIRVHIKSLCQEPWPFIKMTMDS